MSWRETLNDLYNKLDALFCLIGLYRVDNLEENFQSELSHFIYNGWFMCRRASELQDQRRFPLWSFSSCQLLSEHCELMTFCSCY